jgi:hypothetical protein
MFDHTGNPPDPLLTRLTHLTQAESIFWTQLI